MGLKLVTGPTAEVMTVETAKDYLRITDTNDEDLLIGEIIVAARRLLEKETGKAFLSQSWYYFLDAWPECSKSGLVETKIPIAPVISFDEVKVWLYGANDYSDLGATLYSTDKDSRVPRVAQIENSTLPVLAVRPNAIRIKVTCGYGTETASVPKELMIALRMLIRHYYDNREIFMKSGNVIEVPRTIEYLIEDFRDNLF